uniref:U6 snRNA-associated Sm-like protein LSm7 isoform X2 n=1 Tax=Myxine glutinosa TaxID=7769 RepID=UPI0035902487
MADKDKRRKESIFDLSKYLDKTIRVKFQGGREAYGVLKGYDPLLNLVLDGTIEYLRETRCCCESDLHGKDTLSILPLSSQQYSRWGFGTWSQGAQSE